MMMCLKANGLECDEDEVNRVMGARPMQGASWEDALAAAQHYGMRATLTLPATVKQLKEWTDRGIPVMIAWNPEGRPWSHASVVFDVDDNLNVHVADPNIPDPDETVRIVSKDDFYHKWFEKAPNYLIRRPAMAVEREITPEGRQMQAKLGPDTWKKLKKTTTEANNGASKIGTFLSEQEDVLRRLVSGKGKLPDPVALQKRLDTARNSVNKVNEALGGSPLIINHVHRAQKTAGYKGNPDGKDIYPAEIGHGYGEPLAGGTDVMRRLQNNLLHEQGSDHLMRPESPKVAAVSRVAAKFLRRAARRSAR